MQNGQEISFSAIKRRAIFAFSLKKHRRSTAGKTSAKNSFGRRKVLIRHCMHSIKIAKTSLSAQNLHRIKREISMKFGSAFGRTSWSQTTFLFEGFIGRDDRAINTYSFEKDRSRKSASLQIASSGFMRTQLKLYSSSQTQHNTLQKKEKERKSESRKGRYQIVPHATWN